jgi:hypothetical protein
MIYKILAVVAFFVGLVLILATDPRAQSLRDDILGNAGWSLQ